MESYITKEIKSKLQGLAYYQIAGGSFGILLLIRVLIEPVNFSVAYLFILFFALVLYSFSIYCGLQLMVGNIISGLKFSAINQAIQTISFALFGFAFNFIAGLMLSIGIDYTNDFSFDFNFSFSWFGISINQEKDVLKVGFNLVAFGLLYFIGKLNQEIKVKAMLYNASFSENNSN